MSAFFASRVLSGPDRVCPGHSGSQLVKIGSDELVKQWLSSEKIDNLVWKPLELELNGY